MKSKSRVIITILTLVMAFTATLNQTLMITALPVLMKSLNVSLSTVQWLTSGYVLVLGIATPLSANLYQRFSNRKLFLSMVGLFLLGTILGAVANAYWMILIARLIQAAAGGILMSFMQIILLQIYPANQRGVVMGMVSLVVSLAPAIGPTLGGLIVGLLGWRYLFFLILPIVVIIALLALFLMPNVSKTEPVKFDALSIMTSTLGSGSLLYGISILATSQLMGALLIVLGLGLLVYFIRRQLNMDAPMLNVRLLSKRSFWMMTLATVLVFGTLMGTETVMPLLIENSIHQSALVAGMIMLPGAFALGILSPILGSYYDKHGMKGMFIIGIVLVLLSSIPMVMLKATTSLIWIAIIYMVRLIGISFLMSTTTTEALKDLSTKEMSHGTALNNSVRQIGGSLFNTIMIAITGLTASFVSGFHLAMWFTALITVLIAITGWFYLRTRSIEE